MFYLLLPRHVASPLIGFAGCNRFSEAEALKEFQVSNSRVTVSEHFVGEGDSDHAFMHFRYTNPMNERLEEVWIYQRQRNRSWRVVDKQGPKPAGARFGD